MISFSSSEKSGITLSVYALSTPHVVTLYFPCFGTVQLDPQTLGFNRAWLFCIKLHCFPVRLLGTGTKALELVQLHGCKVSV